MTGLGSLRWWLLGAFVLSSVLNYLDRQILAALAPLLRSEFRLTNADYGLVLSAFSVTYAISAPAAGWFIDYAGLSRGISTAVGLWSLAGIGTAFVGGLPGLMACRAALGLGEAAGVPAAGKAIVTYLRPEERALGNAVSQLGLSLGAMMAPPLAVWFAVHYGWRYAFLATGTAGLLWIPFWNWAARRAPDQAQSHGAAQPFRTFIRERQLWAFVLANMFSMTVYTLWSNWTTLYLVEAQRLSLEETALPAALPPLFANAGGLIGGALSLGWMRRGASAVRSRMRVCLLSALILLLTAAVPLAPGVVAATAGICLSFFWISAWSVNLYTMPLDLYGPARAGFAVSLLTGAYGAMQAVFSPLAGALIDRYGFPPVCLLVSGMPLAGWLVLKRAGVGTPR